MSSLAALPLNNAQRPVPAPARFNALRHGLFSNVVVLPDEDRAAYDAVGQSFADRFHPETPEERALVQTLQDSQWRLDRVMALECNLTALGAQEQAEAVTAAFGESLDEPSRRALAKAAAFRANSRLFDQIGRQEGRLRRAFDRAMVLLGQLIAARTQRKTTEQETTLLKQPAEQMPHFTGPMADIKRKAWLNHQRARLRANVTSDELKTISQ